MVLLLGFLTGLALVAPVGPVALTLFGLGAERGRRVALAGAGGVVLADLVSMPVALGGAGALARIDPVAVRGLEVTMGIALGVLALATLVGADRARSAISSIRRPFPTLAAMTIANPLSIVAWTGVALALPPALRTPSTLVWFGSGLVAASAVWHGGLAVASGSLAGRLADGPRTLVTRISGVVLLAVGASLVV